MAITYRTSSAGGGTSGTGNRTATITAAAGDLLIVYVQWSGNSATNPTCTDSGDASGGTYALIGTALNNASADICALFIRTAAIVNATPTITVAPVVGSGTNTAGEIIVIACAGSNNFGAAAVRSVSGTPQFGKQANQTSGVPTPVLPAAALTGNMTLTSCGSSTTSGSVPNASWTERQDASQITPTTSMEVATRDSGFTGTSAAYVSVASSVWNSMIIELDAFNKTVAATGSSSTATAGTSSESGAANTASTGSSATATAGTVLVSNSPILYIQSAFNSAGTGTQATLVVTFSNPTTAGSDIILASNTVFSNAVISSVTDNGSIASTYVRRAFQADLEMYSARNVVAGITQITISFTYFSSSSLNVMAAEYAGATTLGQRVDVALGATGNPSTSMVIHSPNNYVVSFIMLSNVNTFTAQNGTLRNQNNPGNSICLVDNTSETSGTSLTTSVTGSPGGSFGEICTIELSANQITFVQALPTVGNSGSPVYPGAQTAGNCNVVTLFWGEAYTITSVTDTSGNTYVDCGAGRLTRGGSGGNFCQVFVAINIASAGFNTNAVTPHYSTPPAFANDVYIAEYSGVSVIDSNSTGVSTSATATTGSKSTAVANEMAVAFGVFTPTANPTPGSGYVTAAVGNASGRGEILEDQFVASAATSTSASASSTGSTSSGIIMVLLEPITSVTVNATGSSSTSTAGTASESGAAIVASSGSSVSSTAGSVTETGTANVTSTGSSATLTAGTVTVSTTVSVTVNATGILVGAASGVSAETGDDNTAAAGSVLTSTAGSSAISGNASVASTGISIVSSEGSVLETGTANVSATGTLAQLIEGDVSVSAGGSVTVGVAGASASLTAGSSSVSGSSLLAVTGSSATLSTGTTVEAGGAIVTSTGQVITSAEGSVSVSTTGGITVPAVGTLLTTSVGNLSVAGDSNVNVAGALIAGGVGNVLVSIGIVVNSTGVGGLLSTNAVSISGSAIASATGNAVSIAPGTVTVTTTSSNVTVNAVGQSLQLTLSSVSIFGDANILAQENLLTIVVGSSVILQIPDRSKSFGSVGENQGVGQIAKNQGVGQVTKNQGSGKVSA